MTETAPKYRYAYDPADINPAIRIEANEKVTSMQFESINKHLDRIEEAMMRLEKRLWLAVYGVVAAILAQAFQSILTVAP
ncbi:MAG: GTA head formation protein, RCAP_rcc01685 family [Planktomarina sp.]